MKLSTFVCFALTLTLFCSQTLIAQSVNPDYFRPVSKWELADETNTKITGVFPNPASEYFIIEGDVPARCQNHTCLIMEIIDVAGLLYYQGDLDLTTGEVVIDVNEWPEQTYFLRIFSEGEQFEYETTLLVRR